MGKVFATVLAASLWLSACSTPETPAQMLVTLRATEAGLLRVFNEYSSQRPFCEDALAKLPPLCADRQTVISGYKMATHIHEGLAAADRIIEVTGVSQASWEALASSKALLGAFKVSVDSARIVP